MSKQLKHGTAPNKIRITHMSSFMTNQVVVDRLLRRKNDLPKYRGCYRCATFRGWEVSVLISNSWFVSLHSEILSDNLPMVRILAQANMSKDDDLVSVVHRQILESLNDA